MKKFEYITVVFSTMPTDTRLNDYGNEGWQIVNVTKTVGGSSITFMREKEN